MYLKSYDRTFAKRVTNESKVKKAEVGEDLHGKIDAPLLCALEEAESFGLRR